MDKKQITSTEYFKGLNLIFLAMMVGQILFAGIAYFISLDKTDENDLYSIMIMVVPMVAISGFIGGRFLFQQQMQGISKNAALVEKMDKYRTASIIRFALMEGPAFLAIIGLIMTGQMVFLGIAALIIAFFYTLRPTRDKAIKELGLNMTEQGKVNNPNEIIANAPEKYRLNTL